MKLFINKTEEGKKYLNELLVKYKVRLEYGDRKYKYSKPLKSLEEVSPKGRQFIEVAGVKTPYYLIDYPLPNTDSGLKELRVVYN